MNVSDWLSVCDIGGLGEAPITATRFYMYSVEYDEKTSALMLIPECEIDDPPTSVQKYYLTGQQILSNLYNFYEKYKNTTRMLSYFHVRLRNGVGITLAHIRFMKFKS